MAKQDTNAYMTPRMQLPKYGETFYGEAQQVNLFFGLAPSL
jgi:hypothetical protein